MPPEAEWVKAWLLKAQQDLSVAERLLRQPPVFPDIVAFHAQQAVEKALKAYLAFHETEFEKAHTIRYLLDICGRIEPEFEKLRKSAEPLTRYAVAGRYPVAGPETTEAEAEQAVDAAEQAWQFVLSRLPAQLRPPG